MKRNSVFEELRVNTLEVIQEEICCRALWKYVVLEYTSERRRRSPTSVLTSQIIYCGFTPYI